MTNQHYESEFRLPLFPLNTVLFPGCSLPLQIFEQRYLRLVKESLRDNTGFAVVLIESGSEVGDAPQVFSVGNYVTIIDWETLDNGLLGITITAEHKVLIDHAGVQHDGLLTAAIQEIPNEASDPRLLRDYTDLSDTLEQLMAHPLHRDQRVDYNNSFDVLNTLSYLLPVTRRNKQQLLETHDQLEMAELLRSAILQLQSRGRPHE